MFIHNQYKYYHHTICFTYIMIIVPIITIRLPKETADLVSFTEEIRDGKLHFLCSD